MQTHATPSPPPHTHTHTHNTHQHNAHTLNTQHACREDSSAATRYQRAQRGDEIDARFGFERYHASAERLGWLINIHPVSSCFSHFPSPTCRAHLVKSRNTISPSFIATPTHCPVLITYSVHCTSYPCHHFVIMSFTSGWQKRMNAISCCV